MSEKSSIKSNRISQQGCQSAVINLGKSCIGWGKYCHWGNTVNGLLGDVGSSNSSNQCGEPVITDQGLKDGGGSSGGDGDGRDDANARSARLPRDIRDGWLGIGFRNYWCQCNIVSRWSVTFGYKIWIGGGVRFRIGVISCGIF